MLVVLVLPVPEPGGPRERLAGVVWPWDRRAGIVSAPAAAADGRNEREVAGDERD